MASQYSAAATEQKPRQEFEEDFSQGAAGSGVEGGLAQGEMVIEEVQGLISLPGGNGQKSAEAEVGAHDEVGNEGAESAEEYAEATPEQLAAEPPLGESAFVDLQSVDDGFESNGHGGYAFVQPSQEFRVDAGAAALGGEQEFGALVGALASKALPVLASSIGPAVAKGVTNRLSSAAKSALKRRTRGGGLLSTVAKLLETAEMEPVTESSAAVVDEDLIEETVQILEVIIGTDDRIRIRNTQAVPWRRLCALRIHMPTGAVYRGTGFLIGPRVLATAGHCVYMHNQGGWARRIEVIPGADGSVHPFGQATATSFRSVNGWVKDRRPENDYGCIVMPQGAFQGQQLGSFGVKVLPAPLLLAREAVLAGYPGDKPFAELWGMGRHIKLVTPRQLIYDIDTMGGQSGAPVYIMQNGNRYVVGIHNYGASTGNSATRVTEPVFRNLQTWSKIGT